MATRILFPVIAAFLFWQHAFSQVTLEQCQEKARQNYPLVNQFGLIEQSESYNLSNAARAWLPQVSFSAKATWQSEVVELPFTMPGIGEVDKDQYLATIDVSQTIWDGGATGARRSIAKASAEVDRQKYETDLYAIKERINQIYFGILLLNEQLRLNELLQNDLETNYKRVEASMNNGVASQADLDAVRVEQLRAVQFKTELLASKKSFLEMLSAFTGETLTMESVFAKPDASFETETTIRRPELQLFDAQSSLFENQKKLIHAGTMPRLGLFAQGGYGKPGLNMLSNEFNPYFIGGVRFSWNISGFYTQRNEIQLLKINQSSAEIQKQTFLFNTNLKVSQQNNEIEKMQDLLKSDDEIIRLRQGIQHTTEVRVENGTATTSDLIRDINAVNRSMLDKATHEMQLLNALYNLKNTINQ